MGTKHLLRTEISSSLYNSCPSAYKYSVSNMDDNTDKDKFSDYANEHSPTEKFLGTHPTKNTSYENESNCCSKWWHQGFPHQRHICHVVEQTYFHILIIFFVFIDCILVLVEIMLDIIKLKSECEQHDHHNEYIELTLEICHYSSIAILSLFVIELFVKIYAFARTYWNLHEKKMEYLDAVIVLLSLAIDLYFLKGEEKAIGHRTLLIVSFRLWRIVRIINSMYKQKIFRPGLCTTQLIQK
ncbi:unnamed protein product [Didymodactylos carnosus]|uniref:Voltage-gated hydrogen channel 1 n=1 Tax=Didymodactylos carnosus TaxID=1234261 RepID=A0A816BSK4_9BILA|nr:unnamed protein product [Didymodactylos carnosus]CAF4499163.1 unnamed protein product [Didymodactylos carnosus]